MKLRLVIISTLLSVLPLVFLQGYHYFRTEKILYQGRENLIEKDINSLADEILDEINNFSTAIGLISQLSLPRVSLEFNRPEALKKLLETTTNEKSSIDKIVVFDSKGEYFCSSDKDQDVFSLIEKNANFQEVVAKLSQNKSSDFIKVFSNGSNKEVSVIQAIKILDDVGEIKGYLVAKIKDRIINEPIQRLNSRLQKEEGRIELKLKNETKGVEQVSCDTEASINEYGLVVCRNLLKADTSFTKLRESLLILLIVVLILGVVYGFVYQFLVNRILSPMYKFLENLNKITEGNYTKQAEDSKYLEINKLIALTNSIVEELKSNQEQVIEKVKIGAVAKVATQAAHDIRSPLEMLKGIKEDLALLPEESKRRIQIGVNRIEEITFNLLNANKLQDDDSSQVQINELLSLALSVITEKRIEYRSKCNVEIIETFKQDSFGLFSKSNRNVFKSILSNLINNSIEAADNKPVRIEISLDSTDGYNIFRIVDNGPGIPQHISESLFTKYFTTKSSGNGLGLFNAKQDIESFGGQITFESSIGEGTTFCLSLPKSPVPSSFVFSILTFQFKKIIILDDDPAFHDVWRRRFDSVDADVEYFLSISDLFLKYEKLTSDFLLLSDFELMDKNLDGVDLINKIGNKENCILVTARSEEVEIKNRCIESGIKILPKSLVNYIKITSSPVQTMDDSFHLSSEEEIKKINLLGTRNNFQHLPVVLIDDDKLVRLNWSLYCNKNNFDFKCYVSVDDFINNSFNVSKETMIFIDSDLGNNVRGEVVSEEIFNLGYKELFLTTGYQVEDIEKPIWIKKVFSKNPDCIHLSF
jgi:signal transduction histidine kinase/FixJ family two-component response regulator